MDNNNVKQTNLRQADAKVTVVGVVSDKKLEMKTENGIRTIEGTVTIKTSDTNFVQMRVRCADKKKDGTNNKTFTGVMTVMNEYKSIADDGADEADKVRASGQINLFRSNQTGETGCDRSEFRPGKGGLRDAGRSGVSRKGRQFKSGRSRMWNRRRQLSAVFGKRP